MKIINYFLCVVVFQDYILTHTSIISGDEQSDSSVPTPLLVFETDSGTLQFKRDLDIAQYCEGKYLHIKLIDHHNPDEKNIDVDKIGIYGLDGHNPYQGCGGEGYHIVSDVFTNYL